MLRVESSQRLDLVNLCLGVAVAVMTTRKMMMVVTMTMMMVVVVVMMVCGLVVGG